MSIDVQHDPKQHKYYAVVDGHEGEVVYAEEGNGTRNFHHTYVPPELRESVIQQLKEVVARHDRIAAAAVVT